MVRDLAICFSDFALVGVSLFSILVEGCEGKEYEGIKERGIFSSLLVQMYTIVNGTGNGNGEDSGGNCAVATTNYNPLPI